MRNKPYIDTKASKNKHELYKTGDKYAPDQIKDRNGEVVLAMCKKCKRVEIELDNDCIS